MAFFYVRTLSLPKVQVIEADEMAVTDSGALVLRHHTGGVMFAANHRDWFSCQPVDAGTDPVAFEEDQLRRVIEAEKRTAAIRHSVYPERYADVYPVLPSSEADPKDQPAAAK
jgi:hypothetical protein